MLRFAGVSKPSFSRSGLSVGRYLPTGFSLTSGICASEIRAGADAAEQPVRQHGRPQEKKEDVMWIASSLGRVGESDRFARHLVEMGAAMLVGMIASAAIFLSAVGTTADLALRQHAVLFVVIQAAGMAVTMIVWMRYRSHAWRSCFEMAAAMVVPAVPLIGLRLTGVIGGPICGAYCVLTFLAMLLLMAHRRQDYGHTTAAVAH